MRRSIESKVRLISTGDLIRLRRGVMSATVLVFAVLSIAAVAFLVRFLIALHKESRGVSAYRVVRVGPAVYGVENGKADRNTIPRATANGNGANGRRVYEIDEHRNHRIVSTANKPRSRIIR